MTRFFGQSEGQGRPFSPRSLLEELFDTRERLGQLPKICAALSPIRRTN